jgi:hypothetical protein
VIDKIKESCSISIGKVKINVLAYADDIILLSESYAELQQLLSILYQKCDKLKIEINEAKCEFIIFGGVRSKSDQSIRLKDKILERRVLSHSFCLELNVALLMNRMQHCNKHT